MQDKIILNNSFLKKSQLIVKDTFYHPPKEYISIIEKKWENILKKYNTWNGVIYRLDSIDYSPKKILTINKISYKNHITSYEYGQYISNSACYPNGIYVSAYIKTIDNYYLFGERYSKSLSRRKYNFIGGTCNEDEKKIENIDDFYLTWEKEFQEELSLHINIIKNKQIIGLFQTGRYRIAIIYMVNLLKTAKELANQIKLNSENKDIFFISDKNLLLNSNKYDFSKMIIATKNYVKK